MSDEDIPGQDDSVRSHVDFLKLHYIFKREGNGNPLQYSCLKNPMNRGTWWAIVNGVTKSQTWLSTRE